MNKKCFYWDLEDVDNNGNMHYYYHYFIKLTANWPFCDSIFQPKCLQIQKED